MRANVIKKQKPFEWNWNCDRVVEINSN